MKNKRLLIILILCLALAVILALILIFNSNKQNSSDENSLVVVSPHPVDFMIPLIHEFELQTGIEVDLISCGTSQAIASITTDDSADLMWGGSILSVGQYANDFFPYQTSEYDNLYPDCQKVAEGINCFTDMPSVLMINTDIVGDIRINGYQDLLQPQLKGKVAYANPKNSSSSFEQLVNMLYAMGEGDPEKGWDYVAKLVEQLDGNILDTSSQVYEGVASGKYIAGLSFEEAAITQMSKGKHVKIVYMEEGVVSTPDGIYINKNTKHEAEAEAFVDFMLDYDTQSFISVNLGRRSVRTDVSDSASVLAKDQIKLLEVDEADVVKNKDEWISKFETLWEEFTDE